MASGFKIFNASAGSGKTYQLTKYYLKLVLNNPRVSGFRQILALTFTNKAVEEMKSRVLDSLHIFGNPEISKEDNPLFLELTSELGYSVKEMERKSALALKLILHNYNYFEVSTIDKFTHRVINTFAKDLGIGKNFQVELDSTLLLNQAIGKLIQNVSENGQLRKTLIDFSLEKVDADKSWNIVYDLQDIGTLLFKENHYEHLQHLKNKSIQDFELLKAFILKEQQAQFSKALDLAQKALDAIYANNFEDTDFNRQTLPNHFKKIIAGERSTKLYNNKLEEGLINGSLLLKRVKKDGTLLFEQLLDIYLKIKKSVHNYLFFKNAYDNILPLTVLNEIAKEVSNIQKEKEILHISEFNKLISNEITNQPIPYIYERLGERYRNYFIDEFQDTSRMQWQNLVPLVSNALETESLDGKKGSLLLVGDAKQSIYRWRGGDPKQFMDLNNTNLTPFTVEPTIESLNTNWRSFDTLVEFNNEFFTHVANYLVEDTHKDLYLEQCRQNPNHKKGGYLEIGFADETVEDIDLFYCEKTRDSIDKILSQGFSFKDICILVRKNAHGVILANYLSELSIPVISSEALLLNNNPEVQFLISLLQFLNSPLEYTYQYEVLEYLFQKQNDKHDYVAKHLRKLDTFLKFEFDFDITFESSRPLLDLLEKAIATFHLIKKCGAHVIHFLDVVSEVNEKMGGSIITFLNYWDLKKEALAISAPKDQNAVQIMSIHKSKGLEFPFVIFPFADSKINSRIHSKKLWVPYSNNNQLEPMFNELLVNAKNELEFFSEMSKGAYDEENNLSKLDDINVLYVGMTRAEQGNFVFTKESKGETYGDLFKDFLVKKGKWNETSHEFKFGHLARNNKEINLQHADFIPYIYTNSLNFPELAVTSESHWPSVESESTQWGNIMHQILSEIHTAEDVEVAIKKAKDRGDIPDKAEDAIQDSLVKLVNHPELSKYYNNEVVGKNEVELINQDGQFFRPDRLVIEKNEVTIIDYKTGERRSEHVHQLETYGEILQDLDLIVTDKILVYIEDIIEPVFI